MNKGPFEILQLLEQINKAGQNLQNLMYSLRQKANEHGHPILGVALEEPIAALEDITPKMSRIHLIFREVNDAPKWVREFGTGYDVPEIINDRFMDVSWHNDASPSFSLHCDEGETLRIWADHPDKEKRETTKSRFSVSTHTFGGVLLESDDPQDIVDLFVLPYNTDTAERWIRAWTKALQLGFHPETDFGDYEDDNKNRTIESDEVVRYLEVAREHVFYHCKDPSEIAMDEAKKLTLI